MATGRRPARWCPGLNEGLLPEEQRQDTWSIAKRGKCSLNEGLLREEQRPSRLLPW